MNRSRPLEGAYEPVALTFTTTVPKALFTVAAPVPATITQHSVFEHFGVPAKDYMRLARAGGFPTKRLGRLRVVSYDALLEYLTEGAKAEVRFKEAVATAPNEPGTRKPAPSPRARRRRSTGSPRRERTPTTEHAARRSPAGLGTFKTATGLSSGTGSPTKPEGPILTTTRPSTSRGWISGRRRAP